MERTETRPQPPSLTTREPLQGHGARVGDALHALCSPATEPWPDGVIARYLTVAGATVDLTGSDYGADGICNGCQTTPSKSGYSSSHIDVVRMWAQRHASECRALPRPAVNQ
ncbi:hypothetical protein AB0N77_09695 [Streptomyces misionensis]|uniref:hypothetical protein n=1 Tax=Streptomyces misionensis TaxID=67331 RepID=UPI003429ED75